MKAKTVYLAVEYGSPPRYAVFYEEKAAKAFVHSLGYDQGGYSADGGWDYGIGGPRGRVDEKQALVIDGKVYILEFNVPPLKAPESP